MFDPLSVPLPPPPVPGGDNGMGAIPPVAPPPTPPAMIFEKPKPKKNSWDKSVVLKAQGIYPAEAQAKANQAAQAKMPTPTGAWGSPQ